MRVTLQFVIIITVYVVESFVMNNSLNSPCPNVFNYQIDHNGDLYGLIRVHNVKDLNRIQLNVELSVGNPVQGYNGNIALAFDKSKVLDDISLGRPIDYKVLFPYWNSIPPRITKIYINGNLICSGAGIPLRFVPVLTTINLQHTLKIDVTRLLASSDPVTEHFGDSGFGKDYDIQVYDLDVPNNDGSGNTIKRENPFLVFSGNPFLSRITTEVPSKESFDPANPRPNPAENPFISNNRHPARNTISFNPRTTERSTFNAENSPRQGVSAIEQPYGDVCGVSLATSTLILKGNSVEAGAYPWLVALFSVNSTGLNFMCSGSLISNRHVVTAAHCIKLYRTQLKPKDILCILGKLNIQRWTPTNGEQMIEPQSITIHPDYSSATSDADVAVITLSQPVEFTTYIRPICLWDGSDDLSQIVGKKGSVIGWGRDENNDIVTAEPKQVDLPIVSQETCLRSDPRFGPVTSERTFCAGARDGSGPCNGDSGSGFVMQQNRRYMLRGIVSRATAHGRSTCDLSNYVIFTDASKFTNWLLSFLK